MDGLERYDSASAPVPVRSPRLALVADLEPAGFMPPILHGVIREGRWPFSATGSGSLPASGVYGLSPEAQLHRYALIRNIQGGERKTPALPAAEAREESVLPPNVYPVFL